MFCFRSVKRLAVVLGSVVALFTGACDGDMRGEPPKAQSPAVASSALTLEGAYAGDHGFGLEEASSRQLSLALRPGEKVIAVVDGQRVALREVAWEAAMHADEISLPLEASDGTNSRALATLRVVSRGPSACQAGAPELSASDVFGAPQAAGDVGTAACTHNSYAWFCTNCQCRDGIYLRGQSRRYICIYGQYYAQNVWGCTCPFTSSICGEV